MKIKENIKENFYKVYYNNDNKEHDDPKIYNITTKIKILELFLKNKPDNTIMSNIFDIFSKANEDGIIKDYIKRLNEWLIKRNEIIHGMYNKNINDFDSKIEMILLRENNYLMS